MIDFFLCFTNSGQIVTAVPIIVQNGKESPPLLNNNNNNNINNKAYQINGSANNSPLNCNNLNKSVISGDHNNIDCDFINKKTVILKNELNGYLRQNSKENEKEKRNNCVELNGNGIGYKNFENEVNLKNQYYKQLNGKNGFKNENNLIINNICDKNTVLTNNYTNGTNGTYQNGTAVNGNNLLNENSIVVDRNQGKSFVCCYY